MNVGPRFWKVMKTWLNSKKILRTRNKKKGLDSKLMISLILPECRKISQGESMISKTIILFSLKKPHSLTFLAKLEKVTLSKLTHTGWEIESAIILSECMNLNSINIILTNNIEHQGCFRIILPTKQPGKNRRRERQFIKQTKTTITFVSEMLENQWG